MKTVMLQPPVLLPDADRVLWRSGTPPSKAGATLLKSAWKALSLAADAMKPIVALHTGEKLPENLEKHFAPYLGGTAGVTVMLVTLGRGVDERLGQLLAAGETLGAHMFNSAASEAVELLAAWAQMREASRHPGMDPTRRLAPGYNGVPLEAQPLVLGLFPGLDVTCTESFYIVPSKTLTGVWGWVPRKAF